MKALAGKKSVRATGAATGAAKAGYDQGMYLDVVDLRAFYAERLGLVARRLITQRLRKLWPSVSGDRILGVGYATPYLANIAQEAERTLAFMPAAQGVVNWPAGRTERGRSRRRRRPAVTRCVHRSRPGGSQP